MFIEVNGGGQYLVKPYPVDRKKIDIGNYYANFGRIHAVFGWKPRVTLREGLARTLAFCREHLQHYLLKPDLGPGRPPRRGRKGILPSPAIGTKGQKGHLRMKKTPAGISPRGVLWFLAPDLEISLSGNRKGRAKPAPGGIGVGRPDKISGF